MEAIKRFAEREVERLKLETKVEFKGSNLATPKMLKLASALAKELGLKPSKEKTFEEVRNFIKTTLKTKIRRFRNLQVRRKNHSSL